MVSDGGMEQCVEEEKYLGFILFFQCIQDCGVIFRIIFEVYYCRISQTKNSSTEKQKIQAEPN